MTYEENVRQGLDRAYERAVRREVELEDLRLVIFSDHHRGQRDRGDDFLRSERPYNAALGYYLEAGYSLALLGDVEELWACTPGEVLDAYRYTLDLERDFYRDGRYLRFFGNHDDLWESEAATREHLDPLYPGIDVLEGLRLEVTNDGRNLGELFLAHGHQGATFSDRNRVVAKSVVGNLWRPLQRVIRQSSNTPAVDSSLREKHDQALYRWAEGREQVVLLTGHTHRPVFMSESQGRKVKRELVRAREAHSENGDSAEALARTAELRAELEWIKAQGREMPDGGPRGVDPVKPCYFNVGCCSFVDGDITGIEIDGSDIRLVRWPDKSGRPRPTVLARADLRRDVFPLV